MSHVDEIRDQALEVARGWSPRDAPQSWRLTAALCEAIAANDELLEHLAVLPPDRLPALLGSAAIAFLVRRDRPVPLVAYFQNRARPSRVSTMTASLNSERSARPTWTTSSPSVTAIDTR